MVGCPETNRRITLIPSKQDVYIFMCKGEVNGIRGEMPSWVEDISRNTPSETYFLKIWTKFFPDLYTESGRPQCTTCAEFDTARKEKLKSNDGVGASELMNKKREHLQKARGVFCLQKRLQIESKLYHDRVSYVVDNVASKSLPKRRKEKLDAWSKDKLTIHIGGLFEDRDDTVHYSLYPELISESSNTILTQIHETLLSLKKKNKSVNVVSFIFDNHSTQKNKFVLGYFQYLIMNNFLKTKRILTFI